MKPLSVLSMTSLLDLLSEKDVDAFAQAVLEKMSENCLVNNLDKMRSDVMENRDQVKVQAFLQMKAKELGYINYELLSMYKFKLSNHNSLIILPKSNVVDSLVGIITFGYEAREISWLTLNNCLLDVDIYTFSYGLWKMRTGPLSRLNTIGARFNNMIHEIPESETTNILGGKSEIDCNPLMLFLFLVKVELSDILSELYTKSYISDPQDQKICTKILRFNEHY